MATIPPQAVQIRCQNCQTPFTVPVWSFIDVGAQPELKAALLSGQVNAAICPNCGFGGMLSTPLAYHDPQRKLFFVLVPQELNLKQEDQERFVGEVSRLVMDALPADAPRGYVLTPKRFMSMQTLLETVLEAEGISKETLRAQQTRVALLGELAEALEADKQNQQLDQPDSALAQVVERRKDELDYEFFMTIAAYIEAAAAQGRTESQQLLTELRDRVLELSGFDAVAAGLQEPATDEVIAALTAADEGQLDEVIANYRPMLDDDLWAAWEAKLEELDATTAASSQARLELVRSTVERMDNEAQVMFEAATSLLRQAIEAENPRDVLEANREQLNEAFMLVIEANMAAAYRASQAEVAQKLGAIRQQAIEVLEAAMSPQERLLNQLLSAETPGDATKLLRKNMALVTPDFVKEVNAMAEQFEQSGRKEAVERLRQVAREASSLLF